MTDPAAPVPVAVSGAFGRLGREIVRVLAAEPGIELVAGLVGPGEMSGPGAQSAPAGVRMTESPESALQGARVLVEASLPGPALEHAALAARAGVALLVAVTGFTGEQDEQFTGYSRQVPVLVTSNLSLGVSALVDLVRTLAQGLPFDVEIVEAHHTAKRDAPSGTALTLARAAADARGWGEEAVVTGRAGLTGPRPGQEIGVHAVRAGDIVGEHRVIFAGPGERLELSHSAHSRECFARGAAPAVKFLAAQGPGRYSMQDVWRHALR